MIDFTSYQFTLQYFTCKIAPDTYKIDNTYGFWGLELGGYGRRFLSFLKMLSHVNLPNVNE